MTNLGNKMRAVALTLGRRTLVGATAALLLGWGVVATPAAASTATGDAASPTAAQARALDDRIQDELRRNPGGTRVGLNQIAWNGGNVVMTLGAADGDVGAQAFGRCTAGWYCVYEARNFNNDNREMRKLQFRDCNGGGYRNNLDFPWAFNDKTSSWDNRTGATVHVYSITEGVLWTMPPNSRSVDVPAWANDKADFLLAFC